MKRILLPLLLLAGISAANALAQERHVVIPKGSFAIGAQLASLNMDSDNTEWMLVFNPISAKGKISTIAPFAEFAVAPDRTVGLRLGYTSGNAAVDRINMDLLNEGMSFDITNVNAEITTLDATLFHRSYYGIDRRSRLALILEYALSVSNGSTEFNSQDSGLTKAGVLRLKASVSPGLVFFVMNNVSVMGTVSLANVTYNKIDCFDDGERIGGRQKFSSRLGVDVLGIWFGAAFHF
ncbi:MAG: hypothetical protein K5910_05135 [Bacteroidales bacterium]|nr:hypothetical protein [Bacteroidales bacterium]